MHMNQAGLALLKSFEGWRAEAYQDATGVWTIGYGHTSMAGPPAVVPGMTISRVEGAEILQRDLARFAEQVLPLITVRLNANQRSALLSFAYNVGPGNFAKSSVLRFVNEGRFSEVPARLALWTKAGGKVLRGLTRRRAAEGALFLRPPNAEDKQSEVEELRDAGRPEDQRRGKTVLQSTTNRAAAGLTLALLIEQARQILALAEQGGQTVRGVFDLLPSDGGWSAFIWPVGLSLIACAMCAWIVRERLKKSNEHGV